MIEEPKPTPVAEMKLYASEAWGFSIQYSQNWTASEAKDRVLLEVTPDVILFVAVLPELEISVQALANGADVVREDYPDLETIYMGAYSTEAAEWWEMDVAYTEEGRKFSPIFLCTVENGTGYLIGTVAPCEELDRWQEDFVAVIDSFRFLP